MSVNNPNVKTILEQTTPLNTSWNYNIYINNADHVKAKRTNLLGLETNINMLYCDITLDSDFDGGNVVYPNAAGIVAGETVLSVGEKIVIYREVPYIQDISISNNSNYYAEVVESMVNNSVFQTQQLKEEIDRSVKTTMTSGISPEDLVDDLFAARVDAEASAAEALISEGNALASEIAAAASAAGVNLPPVMAGDAGKILEVNNAESGYNLIKRNLPDNVYVLPATTNTSFTSTSSNNPFGFFFDDGKFRDGVERIHFMGLVEIKDGDNMPMYDSAGKKGYNPIDGRTDKVNKFIGFYGSWTWVTDTTGNYVLTSTTGDYIIYTEIFNKSNILSSIASPTSRNSDNSIYLDGADTTNDLNQQGSGALINKAYNSNQIQELDLNAASQGIHTVKVVCGSDASSNDYFPCYGLELVNEAHSSGHELCVTACKYNIKGKEVSFPAYIGVNALPRNGCTGTKGGYVGYYPNEAGYYVSYVQEPEAEEQD